MCTRASAGTDCAEASGAVQQTNARQQLDESKGRIATGDRIRDRNGFRRRAAAFCARIALTATTTTTEGGTGGGVDTVQRRWPPNLGALEVLMVSGRTAVDGYWVLPGGGVENMESTEEAVVRELREEAGILGKVLFCIGEFVDDQRFHHTTLFFLTVREVFTEWGENCENGRQRRWMTMEQARHTIKQNQRGMLERSIKIIERTLGEQLEPAVSKCLSEKPVVSLRAAEDAMQQQQQKQHRHKGIGTTTTTVPAPIITASAVVTAVAIDGVTSTPFAGGHDVAATEADVGHHRHHQTVVTTTTTTAALANGMVEAEDAAVLLNVMMMTNGNGNNSGGGGGGDGRNSAIQ